MGAITVGLVGAIAVTGWFPQAAGESARLFATGMIGLFAGWPVGFAVGGLAAGLLVAFYEWFDTRYATPLREKSPVVDQATKVGLAVGAAGTGVIVLVFGVSRSNRYRPVAPDWIALPVGVCLLLGMFWVIRLRTKRNRETGRADMVWHEHPRWRVIALTHGLGFVGGAIGFLVGVFLHALGWRAAPTPQSAAQPTRKEKQKARPGWWRKRR